MDELHQIAVPVSHEMDAALKKIKRERYGKETQNEMLADLIRRGLNAAEPEGDVPQRDIHTRPSQ